MAESVRRASPLRALTICFFVLFVLAPLYWVVITSIKPSSDYLTTPPVWLMCSTAGLITAAFSAPARNNIPVGTARTRGVPLLPPADLVSAPICVHPWFSSSSRPPPPLGMGFIA